MKKEITQIIALFAIHVATAGMTESVSPATTFTWADSIPIDGATDSAQSGIFVGEEENEGIVILYGAPFDLTSPSINTGISEFVLPDIPDGSALLRANLKWTVNVYNPGSNPSLGDLKLFHSQVNLGPGFDFIEVGTFATPDVGEAYLATLDVTAQVLSDYINDDEASLLSDFQFRADGIIFNGDGFSSAYILPDFQFHELELEFSAVPEPSVASIILGIAAGIATIRSRWSWARKGSVQ